MMTSSASPARSSRWVLLPLILVLVAAAAWTAGWFYAAARAEGVMDAWIEREQREGRTYTCGERTVGGFPFRIEVDCRDLTVALKEPGGTVHLKVPRLLAAAQIYQPDLIIAEATGPMTVSAPTIGEDFVAEWRLLQASMRGRPRDLRRLSIVVEAPSLVRPGQAVDAPVGRAARLEAHLVRGDGADGKPVFNFAGRTAQAFVSVVPALAGKLFDAEATAVVSGVTDLTARRPLAQRLRDWQAEGGRLELTGARLTQDDALAVATGSLGLTPRGRLDGRLDLKLAGLDHMTKLVLGEDGPSRRQSTLLAGLSLLGRSDLEGRPAIAVPLTFRDGRVFFGPIPVAQTDPLF